MSLDQFSMSGKVALVTGASSGIGNIVAKGLSRAGATVVAAARRIGRLQQLVTDIEIDGGKAIALEMDVSIRQSVVDAYAEAQDQVGVVDVIINNAGVADPKNFLKIDERSRDYVMDTNFNGVWNVAQEGARRMIDAGMTGSIINISSVLGLHAQNGQTVYCASKGAVIQLTRALSLDLMKFGIRVNTIAPGWFRSEINAEYFDSPAGKAYIERMPAKRLGKIEELIGPTIMLASDAGSFVNGIVLPVDGAITAALV
ncbi:MAG TPA: SDR family NAD(P)-dependent oxidoreductase [Woeseiaceae bacterium]|nr:SDR family NAD(P)-dependent oxidoreductase [Woeseiaceae bacterium]